jgi:hypothetical protein
MRRPALADDSRLNPARRLVIVNGKRQRQPANNSLRSPITDYRSPITDY